MAAEGMAPRGKPSVAVTSDGVPVACAATAANVNDTVLFERLFLTALENKRLALRYDRQGFIIQSLLQAACLFLVAGRLAREL